LQLGLLDFYGLIRPPEGLIKVIEEAQMPVKEPERKKAMAKKDSDLKKIKELIKIMDENDLLEVEIQHGDDKVSLKRFEPHRSESSSVTPLQMINPNVPVQPAVSDSSNSFSASPESQKNASEQEGLVEIKSPLVGTFYTQPSPDSEYYVETGSRVDSQTVVCIVEAMKVMNEIKSEISGTIVSVLAENGQAVEYGQPLFSVKPD